VKLPFLVDARFAQPFWTGAVNACLLTTKTNVKEVCYKNKWLIVICNDKDVCGMSSDARVLCGG
jgi:hypothetical protein